MTSSNWKRIIGLGLSGFLLFVGSVGLTGCETGGEEELEQEEIPLEEEED